MSSSVAVCYIKCASVQEVSSVVESLGKNIILLLNYEFQQTDAPHYIIYPKKYDVIMRNTAK